LQLTKTVIVALVWAALAAAQEAPARARVSQLSQLSASFQELSRRVHTSVVKVTAVGYRQLEEDESDEPGIAARQQSSGSGVIIDESGYIVTNAHVVIGAQRVQVGLPSRPPLRRPSGPRRAGRPRSRNRCRPAQNQ